jgi:ribokinase
MMHEVICMGSATMDCFVETEKQGATMQNVDGQDKPFITFRSGEKALIKHLQFETGGGGTNTAVCFARLGLRTAYLGNLGEDLNGEQVINKLKAEKVDFIGSRSEHQTNFSVILESTLLKDRTILVYKGASEHLSRYKVPTVTPQWLYVSSLSGESFEAAQAVIDQVKKTGAKVAFNPSNYQIENNKDEVLSMLRKSTVCVFNRDEAGLLVGEGTDKELLQRVHALGPSIVAITYGAQGVAVSDGQSTYRAFPTPNITVRETTGAGDCFASSFVAALVYGKPTDEALRWGMVNVEQHIQHIGAKAGLLTKTELQFAVLQDGRPVYAL